MSAVLAAYWNLPGWAAVGEYFLANEAACVEQLLPQARLDSAAAARVEVMARGLVTAVRAALQASGGMESFLHEYDLSSQEGVLLMCVAEALLRIPDADTADKLIRDKFARGNWEGHLGRSPSLLVNASTWGLLLTGRLVQLDAGAAADATGWLTKLAARSGEPVVRLALRQAMGIMAEQFVMGRTIAAALERSRDEGHAHYRHSFDMLGEAALTAPDAQRYFDIYSQAIATLGAQADPALPLFERPGISIKLSALHPRYEVAQRQQVLAELVPRVLTLSQQACAVGISVTLDAEEAERLELSLEIFATVFAAPALAGWDGFGLAVQAYQKRAPYVITWLCALARQHAKRIPLRLVKGAYWDSEIKRAQQLGLAGYPVFTRKAATDVSYLACVNRLLAAPDAFFPQFATHNAHTLAYVLQVAGERRDFEFQRLHGMGAALYEQVIGADKLAVACRVYAPVGSHEDLLPYLVRRLLENGANSSFVNRISDAAVSIDAVVSDPVSALAAVEPKPNPRLPLPVDLYRPQRRNSAGVSVASREAWPQLQRHIEEAQSAALAWSAGPLLAGHLLGATSYQAYQAYQVADPSDRRRMLGTVSAATGPVVEQALATAANAAPKWALTPVDVRARILEQAADLIEQQRAELMARIIREAGRTIPDALAEVREAADFCRYYAAEARRLFATPIDLPGPTGECNQLEWHGRGVFVCISPWNFPLAIFVGQIAAALAAGNAVIAKPAEQTPLVACCAAQLLLAAGLPPEVLSVLPGPGETIGAQLVADARIAGVAFTGSTATAQAINRTLAARAGPIVPFIAETGGINAMLADSSALPEQLVGDIIASAFNSAGQRCSALRVLFLQQEIAPRVLELLSGAMAELVVGDPAMLSTDIGPVIDESARAALVAHRAKLERDGKLICAAPLPAGSEHGWYFAPCAYEISSLDWLEGEVFGPILHVIRYPGDQLEQVLAAIERTGYGLTLGIHSRIDTTVRHIQQRLRVGNTYVNRNMIGAVVGVQPFGGEGLSGTGPKAGGPHYLPRFASERTVTVNTAAAGGNAALLADGG